MSRYTTTLNEFLNGQLDMMGKSEYYIDDKFVFYDEDYQYIQKILKYDDDVHQIVTKNIFKGFSFEDIKVDKNFKKSFITHFLDREIGRQTIESFASQVLYVTLTHEDYIKYVYSNLFDNYLTGLNTSVTHNKSNSLNEFLEEANSKSVTETSDNNRNASTTLPQSEVNIDVDNTELNFADTNDISKSKSNGKTVNDSGRESRDKVKQTSNTDTISNNYDIDLLNKAFDMKEKIFQVFDKKCFLHVW